MRRLSWGLPSGPASLPIWALALVLAVSQLSGCIQRNGTDAQGRKLKTVSIAFWGGPVEVATMERFLSAFEARNPDLCVNKVHISGDYNTKLKTMIAAGRAPDVFYVLSQDCIDYMRTGALADLAPYLRKCSKFEYDDFSIEAVQQFRIGGRVFALPRDWSSCVVFYNKDLFDQANVPYPSDDWTWNDFLNTAKRLTVRDERGRIVRYGTLGLPGFVWRQWLMQNGGRTFNDTFDKCLLDSPACVQATQFAYDLSEKHHVAPPANDPEVETAVYFMSGKAAMVFSCRWFINIIQPLKRYDWAIAPSPRGKVRVNASGSVGFAMSSQCRNKRAAWKLIEYMCGPDGQTLAARNRWGVPTLRKLADRVDLFEEPEHPNYNYKLFARESKAIVIPQGSPYIPEQRLESIALEETDRMYLGLQSPKGTMSRIASRVNQMISANKAAKSRGAQ